MNRRKIAVLFWNKQFLCMLLWSLAAWTEEEGLQKEMNHHNSYIKHEFLWVKYLASDDSSNKTTHFPSPSHPLQNSVPVFFTIDRKLFCSQRLRNIKCFSFYRHFTIAEVSWTQSLPDEKSVPCQNWRVWAESCTFIQLRELFTVGSVLLISALTNKPPLSAKHSWDLGLMDRYSFFLLLSLLFVWYAIPTQKADHADMLKILQF